MTYKKPARADKPEPVEVVKIHKGFQFEGLTVIKEFDIKIDKRFVATCNNGDIGMSGNCYSEAFFNLLLWMEDESEEMNESDDKFGKHLQQRNKWYREHLSQSLTAERAEAAVVRERHDRMAAFMQVIREMSGSPIQDSEEALRRIYRISRQACTRKVADGEPDELELLKNNRSFVELIEILAQARRQEKRRNDGSNSFTKRSSMCN